MTNSVSSLDCPKKAHILMTIGVWLVFGFILFITIMVFDFATRDPHPTPSVMTYEQIALLENSGETVHQITPGEYAIGFRADSLFFTLYCGPNHSKGTIGPLDAPDLVTLFDTDEPCDFSRQAGLLAQFKEKLSEIRDRISEKRPDITFDQEKIGKVIDDHIRMRTEFIP